MFDCGTNGRVSDGGVLENTIFYKKFKENKLQIPTPRAPENTNIVLPYAFVGDNAFSLHVNFLKPFSQRNLTTERWTFNYRLSRSRRIIENSFGILANTFQVLQTVIGVRIDHVNTIVMACCTLHNYLRMKSVPSSYIQQHCLDFENFEDGTIALGLRTDPELMHNLQRGRVCNASEIAKESRNKFVDYFNGDGQVPWQNTMTGNNKSYLY